MMKQASKQTNKQTNNRNRIPIEGHSAKYLSNTPLKCQGHQKQEKVRNCHKQKEPEKMWWLNIIWYSGWDAGTEKEY